METDKVNSLTRIIEIYELLRKEGEINIHELAQRYHRNKETIKKDIRFIRNAIGSSGPVIEHDPSNKVYKINKDENPFLTCFILLTMLYGSRSLPKEDLNPLKELIFGLLPDRERIHIKRIVDSYEVNYRPMVTRPMIESIGDFFDCIREQTVIKMTYINSGQQTESCKVSPLSIAYDEGFFYLLAYVDSASDPRRVRNLRIDRIQRYEITADRFIKSQHGQQFFEAGKHVNQSFMMHSGDSAVQVELQVKPWLVHYLKSKFPIHRYLGKDQKHEYYEVTVADENSILFWLLQQRTWVEVRKPDSVKDKLKQAISDMAKMYGLL